MAVTARSIPLGPWCGVPRDAGAGLSGLQVALEEMIHVGLSLMDVAGQNTRWVHCAFAS